MNVPEILRRLVRRFGLLLLLTAIGGGAGAAYGALEKPTYTAKAYVVAVGNQVDSATALNFAQAYGRVATSGPVLVKAGAALTDQTGLDQVTAATSPDAPVIELTATAGTATHAAGLANAVASALADYGSARSAQTHVNLAVFASATVPVRPTSPRPPLELLVGAAGGLLIGGLAVLAGVGRAAARTGDAAAEPGVARYAPDPVAPAAEPVAEPPQIEKYLGEWRARYGTKAITAYRGKAATPAAAGEGDEDADEADGERDGGATVNGTIYGRIVGRAPVSGMEEDE